MKAENHREFPPLRIGKRIKLANGKVKYTQLRGQKRIEAIYGHLKPNIAMLKMPTTDDFAKMWNQLKPMLIPIEQ